VSTDTLPAHTRADSERDATPVAQWEQRGTTHYTDRVVEKIAAQAVQEIAATRGAARRLLGVPVGHDAGGQPARVTAEVDGDIVTVAVRMALTYPTPIPATTRQVRHHVITRISDLTGLTVKEVDIDVVALTAENATQGRRVQ
jgi:uncharacterized alkaline shock family protein YloU